MWDDGKTSFHTFTLQRENYFITININSLNLKKIMVTLRFRRKIYYSAVAFLSLFAVCNAASISSSAEAPMTTQQSTQGLKVGDAAPDFTVTVDGKNVNLAYYGSRYKVLNFSSSNLANLKEQYKNADIVFLDVPVDQNAGLAEQYGVSTDSVIYLISPKNVIVGIISDSTELSQKLKETFGL